MLSQIVLFDRKSNSLTFWGRYGQSLFSLIFVLASFSAVNVHAGMSLKIELEDKKALIGNNRELLFRNVQVAFQNWAQYIESDAEVVAKIVTTETATRRMDAASTTNRVIEIKDGISIVEESAAYKIRTGQSVNQTPVDLIIQIDPLYLQNEIWLDSNPETRITQIPKNKLDAVTLFTHEFGHAFGMTGFRNKATGAALQNFMSLFDRMVLIENNRFYFVGPHAVQVNGRPLKLTSLHEGQNLFHYADAVEEKNGSGIMNGVTFRYGTRYEIRPIDLAILKDLGLPIILSSDESY